MPCWGSPLHRGSTTLIEPKETRVQCSVVITVSEAIAPISPPWLPINTSNRGHYTKCCLPNQATCSPLSQWTHYYKICHTPQKQKCFDLKLHESKETTWILAALLTVATFLFCDISCNIYEELSKTQYDEKKFSRTHALVSQKSCKSFFITGNPHNPCITFLCW